MSAKASKSNKKRPRDLNRLAKSIVDEATGQINPLLEDEQDTRNPNAVALGRLGGLKGGKAHANKLTPEQRAEIRAQGCSGRVGLKALTKKNNHLSFPF